MGVLLLSSSDGTVRLKSRLESLVRSTLSTRASGGKIRLVKHAVLFQSLLSLTVYLYL